MIGGDLKAMLAQNLLEHRSHGGIADLLLVATGPADKMVMRAQLTDLVERFCSPCLRLHHQVEFDEKV